MFSERWLAPSLTAVMLAAPAFAPAAASAVDVPCLPLPSPAPQTCPQQSGSVSGAQSEPQSSKQFSVTATPDLARSLLVEVNRTRRAHGLRALVSSARLTKAAAAHAQALAAAGQFTHAWPTTGRQFGTWIRGFYPARGYRLWSAGENLLWASPGFTPTSAVQQWLASPEHRRVMLTPSWRELGIGVVSAVAAPAAYGGADVPIAAAGFGTRRAWPARPTFCVWGR